MALLLRCSSFIFLGLLAACSQTSSPDPLDLASRGPEERKLIEQGRGVYQTICTACHHSDPRKPGAIGPDISGSSLELIRSKVILGKYPEGVAPKKALLNGMSQMPPMPTLEKDIPALHSYLNAFKP